MAFKSKHHAKPGSNHIKLILGIIVLIIIVALLVPFFYNSTTSISSPTNFALSNNQSAYFKLPGSNSTYVIYLVSSSNSSASIYVTSAPVLVKPISSFILSATSSANVSGDGSGLANMQVRLISTKSGSAVISISPLPSSLSVSPSGFVSLILPSPPNPHGTTTSTTVKTTTAATTTISGGTTASTITSASTTTAQVVSQTEILTIANASQTGILMSSYNKLYMQDQACTSTSYNVTYDQHFRTLPPPPESFVNVSAVTPTKFNIVDTQVTSNIYNVSYTPVLPSGEHVNPTVTLTVNVSAYAVTSSKFDTGLNYSTLSSQYSFQSGLSGNCGAYIQ